MYKDMPAKPYKLSVGQGAPSIASIVVIPIGPSHVLPNRINRYQPKCIYSY